jgi:hypothetical protein
MRRIVAPLAITTAQLGAALCTLRLPDARQLAGFLGAGVPTAAGAGAAVELLLWLVVLAMFAVAVWLAVRHAAATARGRARHVWGGVALLTGVCVLSVGLVHHLSGAPVTMAGGSILEADQLAR